MSKYGLLLSLIFVVQSRGAIPRNEFNKPSLIQFFQDWSKELSTDINLHPSEKLQRIEFLNRLIYQIDRRNLNQPIKKELTNILDDMAYVDDLGSNKIYGSKSKFLKNLEFSLKEILEPSENILKFIKSYTEFSSITDPIDPDQFAELRSYTNGVDVEVAQPMSLDEAADLAEQKLNSLQIPDKDWLEFNGDLTKEFSFHTESADDSANIDEFIDSEFP